MKKTGSRDVVTGLILGSFDLDSQGYLLLETISPAEVHTKIGAIESAHGNWHFKDSQIGDKPPISGCNMSQWEMINGSAISPGVLYPNVPLGVDLSGRMLNPVDEGFDLTARIGVSADSRMK